MSPSSKPAVIFVHGALHDSSVWSTLRHGLDSQGFSTHAVGLSSTGIRDPPPETHIDDVLTVQALISEIAEKDHKDTVLVAHSFGGIVIGGAVEGFEKVPGKRDFGVIGCVFLAAQMVPKGQSMFDVGMELYHKTGEGLKWDEIKKLDDNENYSIALNPYGTFYHDISRAEAEPWIAKLRPQAAGPTVSKAESEAWRFVPCASIMTTLDLPFPLAAQREVVSTAAKNSKFPIRIYEIESSHSPFLSKPQELTQIFLEVLGDFGRRPW